MTVQAALAVVVQPPFGGRQLVWIVAGDAAHFPIAGLKTATGVHLFDVTDGLVARRGFRRPHEDRPELLQGQARAIIERLPALAYKPRLPLEVALLADGLAQGGRQVTGIYDRVIRVWGYFLAAAA